MKQTLSGSHTLTILHLSDAHIGNPELANDAESVFRPLFNDLSRFQRETATIPDLIVFSGDLVDGRTQKSSLDQQYEKAEFFLNSLFACFGKKIGDIPFLIAPGNHDVERSKCDIGHKLLRERLDTETTANLMRNTNGTTWTGLTARQLTWKTFIKKIACHNWEWNDALNMTTGKIQKANKTIGLVAFNTCWISQDEQDQGYIWLGKEQFDSAINKIVDCDLKIAVAHHPTDWLHQGEKGDITCRIQSSFDIFFHGHEHLQWFLDSQRHLKVEAGPCYYRNGKDCCYSWLQIDLQSRDAKIILRKFNNIGTGEWGPYYIPSKTSEQGVADLIFLKNSSGYQDSNKDNQIVRNPVSQADSSSIQPLKSLLRQLQDSFFMRWEGLDLDTSKEDPRVYWPVKLRKPTPIHAAQCFTAAGLQRHGCTISLWIDDLGHVDYRPERFSKRLKHWYTKAGGNDDNLEIRRFSEILNGDEKHIGPAWEMLQKWLGTMVYYTDRILKISKIWPTIEDPSKEVPLEVLKEISRRRPGRLMTPAMVWTCLHVMHTENEKRPIITLGGYDEKVLWDAWRTCCDFPKMQEMQVGHLYISKLTQVKSDTEQAVHMEEDPLAWESKEDIENEFKKIHSQSGASSELGEANRMIPWCINNCVLLPNSIVNKEEPFEISGIPIRTLNDFAQLESNTKYSELIEAVSTWLL